MHAYKQKIARLLITLSYLSIERTVNLCKIILSYLLSLIGVQKLQNHSPYFISIEPANYCNLHCPECPVGRDHLSKSERVTFNFELYKKIIDELKPKLLHVIFYFQGEPFLNNQLNELVHYAHQAKLYTSTSTNGQFLNDATAKKIVLSGLDKLIVSVDGSTQKVYETYRTGGNLEKALEGIKRINNWKKTLKSATPFIEIQCLVLKSNEHQLSEMKQLAKSLKADKLTFKTAQLYDYRNGHRLMPTKSKYTRYKKGKDEKYSLKGNQPNRCWRLWSGAVVTAQGAILPCCFDKEASFSFGNIQKDDFKSCWHNEKASDFRAKILKNRKQFEMCKNCTS